MSKTNKTAPAAKSATAEKLKEKLAAIKAAKAAKATPPPAPKGKKAEAPAPAPAPAPKATPPAKKTVKVKKVDSEVIEVAQTRAKLAGVGVRVVIDEEGFYRVDVGGEDGVFVQLDNKESAIDMAVALYAHIKAQASIIAKRLAE